MSCTTILRSWAHGNLLRQEDWDTLIWHHASLVSTASGPALIIRTTHPRSQDLKLYAVRKIPQTLTPWRWHKSQNFCGEMCEVCELSVYHVCYVSHCKSVYLLYNVYAILVLHCSSNYSIRGFQGSPCIVSGARQFAVPKPLRDFAMQGMTPRRQLPFKSFDCLRDWHIFALPSTMPTLLFFLRGSNPCKIFRELPQLFAQNFQSSPCQSPNLRKGWISLRHRIQKSSG